MPSGGMALDFVLLLIFLCMANGSFHVHRKGWKIFLWSECSRESRIPEEVEASRSAQETIFKQALNARFQAEFN